MNVLPLAQLCGACFKIWCLKLELLVCIAVFHVSATIGFLRHLQYLTTTADERKTSSRLQSFHK